MPQIHQLPPSLVAKIAAGEVVERPASVVKELLENSLDAGAKNIKINIEKAGLKKISVIDDGCGMKEKDLLECYKPHTTSKIATEEDLLMLQYFGFRGEALASLAAVSQLVIRSKIADDEIGREMKLINRHPVELNPIGMANGTQIVVANLFENTPARRKYLKSQTTELNQIINLTSKVALANPTIGFSLWHHEKILFELPAGQNLLERIRSIFGDKIYQHLVPVNFQHEKLSISGFIGKPQIAGRLRSRQLLSANQRLFRSVHLSQVIKDAYGVLLDVRLFPVFILDLHLPTEMMDVNIHPRKEEIKFLEQTNLVQTLQQAIKTSLAATDLSYQGLEHPAFYQFADAQTGNLLFHDSQNSAAPTDCLDSNPVKNNYTAWLLKKNTQLWNLKNPNEEQPILQIHNLYLLKETTEGLLIVDQHAAHERILYEEFKTSFENQHHQGQHHRLSHPVIFDLPIIESNLLIEQLDNFQKLGFEIEHFGNNSFKINQVPQIFQKRDLPSLVAEVLDDLSQDQNFSLDVQSEKTIAYLACRAAIKAGDPLNEEERRKLLDKLEATKSLYTCPHGRPVQIKISLSDLHRLFRRQK